MEKTIVFSFLKEGFKTNIPSFRFLFVLTSEFWYYMKESFSYFFFFMAMLYHFTAITLLISSILIKPFCRRRWVYSWMRASGGNFLATNFGRWIWGNQISSPKTINVMTAVETTHKNDIDAIVKVWMFLDQKSFFISSHFLFFFFFFFLHKYIFISSGKTKWRFKFCRCI